MIHLVKPGDVPVFAKDREEAVTTANVAFTRSGHPIATIDMTGMGPDILREGFSFGSFPADEQPMDLFGGPIKFEEDDNGN